jgi:UDP-N-acetylmuramyl pentapeptide phosphotransferase/UDP-N-acetylglucosamine-1-phosphate transferase
LIDDLTKLTPASKFALQALAAVGAGFMGLVYPWTGVRMIDFALSCLWILVLVNAVNLIDVCDGLVGGLALIVSIFFSCFGPGNHLLPSALAEFVQAFSYITYRPRESSWATLGAK